MKKKLPIWVWTPLFARSVAVAEPGVSSGTRTIMFNPEEPKRMLLTFRGLRENGGDRSVTIFDVARFPDETLWAYVADGVNRSGVNPLRGLGALLREPFIDLSRLYHVPAVESGVEAISLGARYPGTAADLSGVPDGFPVCSHLQSAAILAHAEGLVVTGVLVAEKRASGFDFQQVRIG